MEYYKILGVNEDASKEEIEQAYQTLKVKYSKNRFLEGEAGSEAAQKLTQVETAYAEIMSDLSRKADGKNGYSEIEQLLKDGKCEEAQAKLDGYADRDAEWHYLQSVLFYKKNWINESKKQLEIAISMDAKNEKYQKSYNALKEKMQANEKQFYSGNTEFQEGKQYSSNRNRQMGGDGFGDCCTFCATWCCVDALCSSCCR